MPVQAEPTPNPNALKFSVGTPVGGPASFAAGSNPDDPMTTSLLEITGVTNVFMTADFVTISKESDADWDDITPQALEILESHFG